jgi:hypothetical protein
MLVQVICSGRLLVCTSRYLLCNNKAQCVKFHVVLTYQTHNGFGFGTTSKIVF